MCSLFYTLCFLFSTHVCMWKDVCFQKIFSCQLTFRHLGQQNIIVLLNWIGIQVNSYPYAASMFVPHDQLTIKESKRIKKVKRKKNIVESDRGKNCGVWKECLIQSDTTKLKFHLYILVLRLFFCAANVFLRFFGVSTEEKHAATVKGRI